VPVAPDPDVVWRRGDSDDHLGAGLRRRRHDDHFGLGRAGPNDRHLMDRLDDDHPAGRRILTDRHPASEGTPDPDRDHAQTEPCHLYLLFPFKTIDLPLL
jgi:hypothetical protein